MYEAFYGLHSRPFLTAPDPDFVYWSEAHSLAFTMLRYGLSSGAPITVITGEIGSGKTTMVRRLLGEIPDDIVVGLVSNMQAGRGELLHWVMMALGSGVSDEPYVRTYQRFETLVLETYAAGRRVALIIDEAQNLSIHQLEELRMLSNINTSKDNLLQLILVGQPQLRDILSSPALAQFGQRISADFNLTPLGVEDVQGYIDHRLAVAGAQWRIFPERTVALIWDATRGVPRLINILCDMCLVYGFAAESKVIDENLLREFLVGASKRGIYQQFTPVAGAPTIVRAMR